MNRGHLHRKVITDKNGKRTTVWVKMYHTSKNKFDKFKTSKILSGIGINAYGRGFYFAEIKKEVKRYAEKGDYIYTTDIKNKEKFVDLNAHISKYPKITSLIKDKIKNNPKAMRKFNTKVFQKTADIQKLIGLWKLKIDDDVTDLIKDLKFRGIYIKPYSDSNKNTVVAFYPNDIVIKGIKKIK